MDFFAKYSGVNFQALLAKAVAPAKARPVAPAEPPVVVPVAAPIRPSSVPVSAPREPEPAGHYAKAASLVPKPPSSPPPLVPRPPSSPPPVAKLQITLEPKAHPLAPAQAKQLPHPPLHPPPGYIQGFAPKAHSLSGRSSLDDVAPVPPERKRKQDEAELDYFKRRLKNQYRAGRNRTFYDVLNRLGAEAAAPLYVPRTAGQNVYASTASSSKAPAVTGEPAATGAGSGGTSSSSKAAVASRSRPAE
jgi:hypothetical protein